MSMTETEIYGKVHEVVVDVLAVEDEEVTPEARLSEDLGAESIDYLAIAFQLGKIFGIEIKPDEMIGSVVSDEYVEEGKISEAGMEELRRSVPEGNFEILERTRAVGDFRSIFTVATLVQFVTARLEAEV
jgi:acyl carrier protein